MSNQGAGCAPLFGRLQVLSEPLGSIFYECGPDLTLNWSGWQGR